MITYGLARTRAQIREAKSTFLAGNKYCPDPLLEGFLSPNMGTDYRFTCAWDDGEGIGVHISRLLNNPDLNYHPGIASYDLEIVSAALNPAYNNLSLFYNLVQTLYTHVLSPGQTWISVSPPGPIVEYTLAELGGEQATPIDGSPFIKVTGTAYAPRPYIDIQRQEAPDWVN